MMKIKELLDTPRVHAVGIGFFSTCLLLSGWHVLELFLIGTEEFVGEKTATVAVSLTLWIISAHILISTGKRSIAGTAKIIILWISATLIFISIRT